MMSDQREALKAAEIGLANLLSYQSSINAPTIGEFGQARRALDAVRKALTQPQAQQAAAVPAGWREFIENIATAGSEPLNSLAGGSDKASRRHWLGVIRDKARDLLSSAPAAPQSDDELLAQALGALQYHTEQTRPIERTRLAIEAIDRRLHGGITGGEGG